MFEDAKETTAANAWEWLENALSLPYEDGAINASADGAMAVAMQQGPREEQQDCGVALIWVLRGIRSPRCAAVVADGMGGMEDGGWASRQAVRIVVECCLAGQHDRPRDMLAEALARAQREVVESLKGRGGTTLTAAVWEGRSGMLVHTGDTRAHLIESGHPLRCLTTDHTEAGLDEALERWKRGSEPDEYWPTEPDSNLIDAIGAREGVLAERHILHTPHEGRYVFTSDGAHDPVRGAGAAAFEEARAEVRWTARRSVEALWERLADETLTDNATVVAIEPGRALQFAEDELGFGEVMLVGPKGVLRATSPR